MRTNGTIAFRLSAGLAVLGMSLSVTHPAMAQQHPNSTTTWAYFWAEGKKGSWSTYFFNLGAVETRLTPEGEQAVNREGINSMSASLADYLVDQQYQVMRVIQVSEEPGKPQSTEMTLHFKCSLGKLRLARTIKTFADKPAQVSESDQWYSVPISWAYQASTLACNQKPWRDAWNATAKHWICKRFVAPKDSISRECDDAITRSNIGYVCDLEATKKIGIFCTSMGRDSEDVRRFVFSRFIPMLNGEKINNPSDTPPSEPFVGVKPKLPEDN